MRLRDMNGIMAELEAWILHEQDHHHDCGDDCCADSGYPYVNSVKLMEKIKELRGE
jgi:hypothetical protein